MTVSEAKYTYWHAIVDMANASDLSKEEWCRKNCISIKTYNHYEGVFKRQETRRQEAEDPFFDTPFFEIPMLVGEEVEDVADETHDPKAQDIIRATIGTKDGSDKIGPDEKNVAMELSTGDLRVQIYNGTDKSTLQAIIDIMRDGNA